jgi:hypothetical protein
MEEQLIPQWEYKTVRTQTKGFLGGVLDEIQFDQILNELGYDGWELVSAFTTNKGQGTTRDVIAVLKRPRYGRAR